MAANRLLQPVQRPATHRLLRSAATAAAVLLPCSAVLADVVINDFENGSVGGFGWLTGDSRGIQPWSPDNGPANGAVITASSGPLAGSKVLELTGTPAFNFGQSGAAPLGLDIDRPSFFANDQLEFDWYPVPNGGDAGYSQLYNIVINSEAGGFNAAGGYGAGDANANQFYFTGYTGNLHHVVVNYTGIKSNIQSQSGTLSTGGGWLQLAIQPNSGGGAPADMYFDNFKWSVVPNVWNVDADGNWTNDGNWSPNAPNAVGRTALFGPKITAPHIVTVDGAKTIGQINFDNANKYTVAGASTITLDSTSPVGITVSTGSHDINAPLALAKDANIIVGSGSSTLTLSNLQPSTVGITKSGSGALAVNNVRAGSLTVNAGTVSVLTGRSTAGTSKVGAVTVAAGAALDLGNNDLIVDYTGTSPFSSIQSLIKSGYNGGSWTGNGIRSSSAAAGLNGHTTALGYAEASEAGIGAGGGTFSGQSVDNTSVLVRYTYAGDGNVDGKVDLTDFTFLAANFNGSNKNWLQGDYNYDGTVNLTDFTFLAANFNQSLAAEGGSLGSAVPEPTTVALLALGATALIARRRRSW